MRAFIVYDSVYGNTEKISEAIAEALGPHGNVRLLRAGDVEMPELSPGDLLIAGCPTHAGRPTQSMQVFLDRIPEASLQGIKACAFDTRVSARWVKILGFAAGRIASSLKKRGANPATAPEGYFVTGKEGPLKDGELRRAENWARGIVELDA